MLVIFWGNDRVGVRDGATAYIRKNLPAGGVVNTVVAADYQPGQLQDSLGATSLFGDSEWFVLDTPSQNGDYQTDVESSLSEMTESQNNFIVLEGTLLAPEKKKYEKFAKEMFEFKADVIEKFNNFSLAEALAEKDKKRLWVLLQTAKSERLPEEVIIGMLWWQLKALRLAAYTKTAAEAGMKDFPYNKAKRALTKFGEGEVEKLSSTLLSVYHDGHAGLCELDLALERWVLGK